MERVIDIRIVRLLYYFLLSISALLLCSFSTERSAAQDANVSAESKLDETVEEDASSRVSKTPIRIKPTDAVKTRESFNGRVLLSTFGALALVIGCFFGLVYILKLIAPNKFNLRSGLVEVVDSVVVSKKVRLSTIKWGNQLFLLAVTNESATTIGRLDDSDEIDRTLANISKTRKDNKEAASIISFFRGFKTKDELSK